jgi:hypothetical protein
VLEPLQELLPVDVGNPFFLMSSLWEVTPDHDDRLNEWAARAKALERFA